MTKTLLLLSGHAELVASRSRSLTQHVSSLKMTTMIISITSITTTLIAIIQITIPITLIITLIYQTILRWPIFNTLFVDRICVLESAVVYRRQVIVVTPIGSISTWKLIMECVITMASSICVMLEPLARIQSTMVCLYIFSLILSFEHYSSLLTSFYTDGTVLHQ